MLKIGAAKGDITAFYQNAAMLGYAMFHHIMKDIESPLYARTFVFENETSKVCFINCELGFITPSIKKGVLKELNKYYKHFGYTQENILMSAQHTHCAPGGYSYYPLYNTAVPGFIHEVYEKIVSGIIESIVEAEANKKPGSVKITKGSFEPETTISFNRSIKAYNKNKDVEPLPFSERHLAVDRGMTLLKILDDQGVEMGSINWFAVHTTSLSNNFYRVCSDNKGYASKYMEQDKASENKNYQAIFAQGNCGDVSPKWIYNPKHPFQRGKYEGKYTDDLKSAKYSGHIQFQKAKEVSNSIKTDNKDVGSKLDAGIVYVDFSALNIDPKFTDGAQDCLTSPACMGVSMLEGSHYDGPGMHPFVGFFAKGLSKTYKFTQLNFVRDEIKKADAIRKYKAQGAKNIALESVTHRIFMAKHARKFVIPGWADETIGNLKKFDAKGAYGAKPWTPQILPLQIIRLGSIAICAFPFEITTVAGYRLQKTLEDAIIGKDGYEHVILCPYSNAYSGYITTTEEYEEQMYEAGHTVFGQWSLNALQQEFHHLAKQMLLPKESRNLSNDILPPDFTEEELEKIKHFESTTARREKKRLAKKKRLLEKHKQKMNKKTKVLK